MPTERLEEHTHLVSDIDEVGIHLEPPHEIFEYLIEGIQIDIDTYVMWLLMGR